jgi:hypothetical protein
MVRLVMPFITFLPAQSITSTMGRKADPKQIEAITAITTLLSSLPPELKCAWRTVLEMHELLVAGGLQDVEVDSVRCCLRHPIGKSGFDSRRLGKIFYFRDKSYTADSLAPNMQRANCDLQATSIEKNYFLDDKFANKVSCIRAYFPSRGKRKCDDSPPSSKSDECDESPPSSKSDDADLQSKGDESSPPSSKSDDADLQSLERKRRNVAEITPELLGRSLKCCPGWTGVKVHELFRQSLAECSHDISMDATLLKGFGIASAYMTIKGADGLGFYLEGEMYALRSKGCTRYLDSGGRAKLCKSCGFLASAVSTLRGKAADKPNINPDLRMTKANAAKLLPEDFTKLVKVIRKEKDDKLRNATKREMRLRASLDRGGSSKIAFDNITLFCGRGIDPCSLTFSDLTRGEISRAVNVFFQPRRREVIVIVIVIGGHGGRLVSTLKCATIKPYEVFR